MSHYRKKTGPLHWNLFPIEKSGGHEKLQKSSAAATKAGSRSRCQAQNVYFAENCKWRSVERVVWSETFPNVELLMPVSGLP